MRAWLLILTLGLVAGCSELQHEAPYDPDSPSEKQARGVLKGKIRLEGESDFSEVSVGLQNVERTYSLSTKPDGTILLTGIVPGAYELSVSTRYFEPFTETVEITLGSAIDIGERTLSAKRARVAGKAGHERSRRVRARWRYRDPDKDRVGAAGVERGAVFLDRQRQRE